MLAINVSATTKTFFFMCLRATIEKINYENSCDFDAEGILVESDAVTRCV